MRSILCALRHPLSKHPNPFSDRRPSPPCASRSPATLEATILKQRHKRVVPNRTILELGEIANKQFQLEHCMSTSPGTAPLSINEGHVFHGLRDTLIRLSATRDHALQAKGEEARAALYFKVFQLRETTKTAIQHWEVMLQRGQDTGNDALVTLARLWLEDMQPTAFVATTSEHGGVADSLSACKPLSGFNRKALAHMKP